jgi:hypothetical protein
MPELPPKKQKRNSEAGNLLSIPKKIRLNVYSKHWLPAF